MENIEFIIELGENNHSAYSPQVGGLGCTGSTIEELKQNIDEGLAFHFEGMKEDGEDVPETYKISYKIDIESLFEFTGKTISQAALSNVTGINEGQLGHYIQGRHKPRKDKLLKIESGLHQIGKDLLAIKLS